MGDFECMGDIIRDDYRIRYYFPEKWRERPFRGILLLLRGVGPEFLMVADILQI
jgi:hypothetical protein